MAVITDKLDIINIVKQYTDLVRKEISIKHVYLYGSYTKGNFTEDSDIDLAIVGDDFSEDLYEYTLKLMKIRRKVDTRIEPHPFRTSDFTKDNPFVLEILNSGVKIV
ncbi:MAG: nucleotidyltransferase domain-containing protein [Clostridia bacterium]